MIGALARKIFGSSNERRIKAYQPRVAQINALEKELEKLSDDALRARTAEFKQQLADGSDARRYPGAGLRHRAAKPPSARSASATSTCSSSAAWSCTTAASPR